MVDVNEWLQDKKNFRTSVLFEFLRCPEDRQQAVNELRSAGFDATIDHVNFWFNRFAVRTFTLNVDDDPTYDGAGDIVGQTCAVTAPGKGYKVNPEGDLAGQKVMSSVLVNAFAAFHTSLDESEATPIEVEIHLNPKNVIFFAKVDDKPTFIEFTYCNQGCVVSHGKKRDLLHNSVDYSQLAVRAITMFLCHKQVKIDELKIFDAGEKPENFFKVLLTKLGREDLAFEVPTEKDGYWPTQNGKRITAKKIIIESPTDNCYSWIEFCKELSPEEIHVISKKIDDVMIEKANEICTDNLQKLSIRTTEGSIGSANQIGSSIGWSKISDDTGKVHTFKPRLDQEAQ